MNNTFAVALSPKGPLPNEGVREHLKLPLWD
jgi:hypothetical protein